MPNTWIQHVLKVKKDKKISFKEALREAGKTFKSKNNNKGTKKTRKHHRKKHKGKKK